CYRLKKYGDILCIPEAKMQHDTRAKQANGVDWREYYDIRNHLLIVKQYYAYRYYLVLKWLKYLKRASFLSRLLIKSTAEGREMAKTAIRDAKEGKAGVHEKYRP
ncbi:MAG: hypothetical protein IJY26_02060, partial [Clostridia bacterium]|nr:hypothetical protein [Clostridia bacterium]